MTQKEYAHQTRKQLTKSVKQNQFKELKNHIHKKHR